MPPPLLQTKLYLPKPRAGAVRRPRLNHRLDAGSATKLLLLSAPAGFGKTTVLAEWLAGESTAGGPAQPAAWLSLDAGDNDPATFWTYVITAVQGLAPGVGANEVALLASPRPPPIDRVLTTWLNDLGASRRDADNDIVLVLDDYHLVDAHEIHDAMTFLLDHLPPRLRLVIASRADPPFPLARLRARGDLLEIRAAELRFTAEEAAAYLTGVMGLRLTAQDVTALEERTEGWIAALQLAALSMQGRRDVTGFIAGFAGDDRYIVDYLAEEVLQRQPAQTRDFLLQTSLLGRLNGSLCDAVTGKHGGKTMLENLDRGNVFIVALDDRRQSYRYHHLFADVLRARLSDESPDLARQVHRRASDWFAEHGERSEAIAHAVAGQHYGRAAHLMELAMPALRKDRQEATLRGWIEQLPEEIRAIRPALSNGYAGALLAMGEFDAVDKHLLAAEHGLDEPFDESLNGPRVDEEYRRLPAAVAVHRAGLALVTGDLPATVAHALRALDLLELTPDLLAVDQDLGRAAASALIGLASWAGGDLETARQAYLRGLDSMRRAGHVTDVLGLSLALADIQITQGSLRAATYTYEQALRLVPEAGLPVLRGTADMYVGLSSLHLERNDLPAAERCLARGEELGEHAGLPQNTYRRRVARARICAAGGDLDAAADLLTEAEDAYEGDFSPDVRPVAALRARIWIALGRVDDAVDWSRQRGLSAQDDLDYRREYEHITLARILLARHRPGHVDDVLPEAITLLEGLRRAAEAGRRTGSLIEILVLQAVAHDLRGDRPAASGPLKQALQLAEPEGYVRVFADEGPAMASLLAAAGRRKFLPDYVNRLLASIHSSVGPSAGPVGGTSTQRGTSTQHGLIEPLSPRELDVLRLLGSDLGGPDIARHLVVSLNTVRTHTKNIYAKLGVTNRRAAVHRAQDLDL